MNNLNRKIVFEKNPYHFFLAIACSVFFGMSMTIIKPGSAQIKYERFADYCLNFYELPVGTKVVVQSLISSKFGSWSKVVDTNECYEAEKRLNNIKDDGSLKDDSLQITIIEPDLVIDLGPLNTIDTENITEIRFSHGNVENIAPLANFKNLEILMIGQNKISDISPLSSLTSLKELDLRENIISDLSPLSSLINLEKLDLGSQGADSAESLRDLTPLSSLSGLRELRLDSNNLSDVSALSSLTRLERLYLRRNQITDITPFSSLTSLTQLWLDGNNISSENLICPIDVTGVCEFGSQRASNTDTDSINDVEQAQPQNSTRTTSVDDPSNPTPNSNSNDNPEVPEDNQDSVEEVIEDASEAILDGLF